MRLKKLPDCYDRINRAAIYRRRNYRLANDKPLCGDWVEMLDGTWERFCFDLDDERGIGMQTSHVGSFYTYRHGGGEFSGGLNPSIESEKITSHPEIKLKLARFWMFNHEEVKAHNSIYFQIPVRVWKVKSE